MSSYHHHDYAASRPSIDPFLGNAGLGEDPYAFDVVGSGRGLDAGNNESNGSIASNFGDFYYETFVSPSPEPHAYWRPIAPSSLNLGGDITGSRKAAEVSSSAGGSPPYPRNVNHDRTGVFPSDQNGQTSAPLSETELEQSKVKDNPRPTESMTQRTRSGLYPCLWGGDCNRTFSRPFDRNRHMQTHWLKEAEPRFECPEAKTVPWCDRTGANAFTREDHRDQHRRKVHMVKLPPKPRGLWGKLQGNGLRDRAIDGNSPASERTR